MKKNIPTFQFVIDDSEESGVKAISIVGDPAFQSSMITFSKEKPKFVALADKKYKQICAGLSLIPDVPVYRVDEIFGEYYGVFSKETIEKIVEKYHMEMNMNKLNLNHDENSFIDAFMVEDFIVDSEARVADLKLKGIEHPNIMGAWYTAFKIKDKNVKLFSFFGWFLDYFEFDDFDIVWNFLFRILNLFRILLAFPDSSS